MKEVHVVMGESLDGSQWTRLVRHDWKANRHWVLNDETGWREFGIGSTFDQEHEVFRCVVKEREGANVAVL